MGVGVGVAVRVAVGSGVWVEVAVGASVMVGVADGTGEAVNVAWDVGGAVAVKPGSPTAMAGSDVAGAVLAGAAWQPYSKIWPMIIVKDTLVIQGDLFIITLHEPKAVRLLNQARRLG